MLPFDTMLAARDAVRSKKITAAALTRACLDQIEKHDGTIKAFNSTAADRAMKVAAEVDAGTRTGPLAGVPIAIKDNLCTTWGTTTCSSKMLENFHAPYDATVIKKLEAAGAVIVGKTNLDEFAMGSSTENSAFKTTRNPWDTATIPGGSSGGSAAALAASMCCASLGSDTGGSIRQPAALTGIVGLKPTYGRVSRYGLIAFASSLDQIGPFTRDVRDCALMTQVISGHDDLDSTSTLDAVPDYLASVDQPLTGLRIGIAREFDLSEGMDAEVTAAYKAAIDTYKKLGATIVDVTLPHTGYGIAAYYVIAPCEASSNLARYDGIHFGHRTKDPVKDIVELFSKSRYEGFGDEVKRRIMIGTYALSSGYYDAYYNTALKVRTLICRDFDNAFKQCDVVISPTSPTPAFKPGDKSDPLAMYLCDVFTVTCNIAGIAGISIPCGFTSGAKPLPIGLQLLGPAFGEEKLLRIARMYEAATDWHTKRAM
jgi:aspartyl-tRNA(Asn)/glutamyl-tRNA(Gln) amidotransferase subunit A